MPLSTDVTFHRPITGLVTGAGAKLLPFFIVVLILFMGALEAKAEPQCSFKKPQDLVARIKTHHPELKLIKDRVQVHEAKILEASRRLNPQLGLATHHGLGSSTESSESSLSLQHVFELGDKRDLRRQVAKEEKELGLIQIGNDSDSLLIDSVLKMTRLSQASGLIHLYEESLQVFKKMRAALPPAQKLSPEQRVQQDLLDMEVSKHQIMISSLKAEIQSLEGLIKFYAGLTCEMNWEDMEFDLPALKELRPPDAKTPELREAEKELSLSLAKTQHEDSLAYPDLKIGPSVQRETEAGDSVNRFGVALSLDLPLFYRNEGGKARARAEERISKARLRWLEDKNDVLLESLYQTYQITYTTLQALPNRAALEEKHHRIERLFVRGLISVSTMLDSHDELLNLIEARDTHTLTAVKALLHIQQAHGQPIVSKEEGVLQ